MLESLEPMLIFAMKDLPRLACYARGYALMEIIAMRLKLLLVQVQNHSEATSPSVRSTEVPSEPPSRTAHHAIIVSAASRIATHAIPIRTPTSLIIPARWAVPSR
jgi:hypothetical protein